MTIDEVYTEYVAAFDRSLGEQVDAKGIRHHLSACFVGARPEGVQCGQNGTRVTQALEHGYAFHRQIGTRHMGVRDTATIPVDDAHALARVAYRAISEKPAGPILDLELEVSCMTDTRGKAYEIFAFVTGDEQALYEQHGLLQAPDVS